MDLFQHPDFEVLGALGKGGQAVVYRARHKPLERAVAIKVLLEGTDPDVSARLLREARLLAGLKHPNLVQIYDVGTIGPDERPYLVMECVEGGTLSQWMKQQPPTLEQALSIATQLAGAMGAAHEVGIIHRDIKPANVLMDRNGTWPKLADFGVAKPADSELTQAGLAMGTPSYMAPECFQGEVGPASDVYALGLILYRMVVGRLPFRGKMAYEWMAHHLGTEVVIPEEAKVPKPVADAILRLLAKDPAERPADGAAAEALLLSLTPDGPTLAVPTHLDGGTTSRTASTGMLVGGAMGLSALLGGAGVLLLATGALLSWWWTAPPEPAREETPVVDTRPTQPTPPPPVPAPADVAPSAPQEGAAPPAAGPPATVEPATAPAPSPPSEPVEPEPVPTEAEAVPDGPAEPAPAEPAPEAAPPPAAQPVEPTPAPSPPPAAAVPTGRFRGTVQGRPVDLLVAGGADDLQITATLTVGANQEVHHLTGRAIGQGSSWQVDASEAGGPWGLTGMLDDASLTGRFTIKGKPRSTFEATR